MCQNDCGAGDARSFGRSHPPFTLFLQGVVLLPINFLLFNVRDIRRTNMAWKLLVCFHIVTHWQHDSYDFFFSRGLFELTAFNLARICTTLEQDFPWEGDRIY